MVKRRKCRRPSYYSGTHTLTENFIFYDLTLKFPLPTVRRTRSGWSTIRVPDVCVCVRYVRQGREDQTLFTYEGKTPTLYRHWHVPVCREVGGNVQVGILRRSTRTRVKFPFYLRDSPPLHQSRSRLHPGLETGPVGT